VASAAAAVGHPGAADESMAATLWGYMDHASSWREALDDLRRYVADGHTDSEVFAAVGDAIEQRLAVHGDDEREAVLGFYPGAVLMLHGLRSVREYGTPEMFAAQSAFVRDLMGAV
jgi:hypothetical protein